ncbi:class I SAM-dependent methyltransferase [Candidatus Latescibacterota bacterium]
MSPKYTDIGSETLQRMKVLEGYNRWIVDEIRSWVGNNVLEVGAGTGNISQFFLDRKQLILTDISKTYIDALSETYKNFPNVFCEQFNLEESGSHLTGHRIDTIIGLNVLEHIKDDLHALREMASILSAGGRVILQLPAHKILYGSLDRNLGHNRRYTVREIKDKFTQSGLLPEKISRINMFGTFGWFLCSRILRKKILPEGQLSLFNTLTPVFVTLERLIPVPFGLSILAIGRKDG